MCILRLFAAMSKMVSTMRVISIFLIFAILEWAAPCQDACAFDPTSFDVDRFIERLQGRQSITFEMAEIRRHWNELSDEAKAKLSRYYVPAPLSDTRKPVFWFWKSELEFEPSIKGAKTLTTDHFRIIWNEDYEDSLKYSAYYTHWGDPDQDGLPTFIERLAGTDPYDSNDPGDNPDFSDGICETVWAKEVKEMGFNPPDGSDEHYIDIYIANTGVKNAAVEYGLTLPDNIYGVANTYLNNIPYIILNAAMSIDSLKVTFAHEFFHNIQFSYLSLDYLCQDNMNLWLAESTAVWMEDAIYPFVNDYLQYINYWVDFPQRFLFSSGDLHEYGSVIFQKYLTENYNHSNDLDGSDVIRSIWEHAAETADPIEAIGLFLSEQTVNPIKDLNDAYVDFALKNLDMKHNYADGSLYNPVYFVMDFGMDTYQETLYDTLNEDQISDYNLPEHYGANYIRVALKDNDISALANRLTFNFKGEGSDGSQPQWSVFIIPEGEDGALYPAMQVDVGTNAEGAFIKEDTGLYRAAHVVITAVPAQDQSFSTAKKFAYNFNTNSYVATRLTDGWNLINIPAGGKDDYETIQPSITSAWRWDSDDQKWEVCFPNQGDEFTNLYISSKKWLAKLTDFGNNDGVWLLSQEKGVEVTFSEPAQIESIPLNKGWNLAGINSLTSYNVSALKDSPWCKSVWKWNSSQNVWGIYVPAFDDEALKEYVESKGFSRLDRIYYGEGFWIHSLEPAELILE